MLHYFAWRNQKIKDFCSECVEFSRLVIKLASHLSRFAVLQKVSLRDIGFVGPWWMRDGVLVFKLKIRGRPIGPKTFRSPMKSDDF
jgi:hypothetical protein